MLYRAPFMLYNVVLAKLYFFDPFESVFTIYCPRLLGKYCKTDYKIF